MRSRPASQRMGTNGDMGEIPAGGRTRLVDHAAVVVQKDTPFSGVGEHSPGRGIRIRERIQQGHGLRRDSQESGDGLKIGLT